MILILRGNNQVFFQQEKVRGAGPPCNFHPCTQAKMCLPPPTSHTWSGATDAGIVVFSPAQLANHGVKQVWMLDCFRRWHKFFGWWRSSSSHRCWGRGSADQSASTTPNWEHRFYRLDIISIIFLSEKWGIFISFPRVWNIPQNIRNMWNPFVWILVFHMW